ncbi:MAG: BtrH N-terminal domain-containing protein [Terracidiphilus sp.]|nr:BtrH N-terminal domain-containing protein [Terracidiphilus sp.]MDR3775814.1 BtrH N-terminal domain-containing protein [Terracidiphilus sp.]
MKDPNDPRAIEPFPHCPALDGYHCVTNSLAKVFHHSGHPLSEDMLLGLGAGMGFIYWQMKMGTGTYIFVGGRGNGKNFHKDLGSRTGVVIKEITTSSTKKAEASLLRILAEKEPVMLGGDMGFLPWFHLPEDYHFGGHAFVVCGFDGDKTVLASDMDPQMPGLKKGLYSPISLEQLSKARNSPFKPFPPKNLRMEFDFAGFRNPGAREILQSIEQTIDYLLHPPIKNLGVEGMRHTADQLLKWPAMFADVDLRMNLFNLYIFIEIGGTGSGCFRFMYSRFLEEGARITGNPALAKAAIKFNQSGQMFSKIGLMFKDAQKMKDVEKQIDAASGLFREIADMEEEACHSLKECISDSTGRPL